MQLVLAVDIFNEGTSDSTYISNNNDGIHDFDNGDDYNTLLIALTIPVSSNSMALPVNLITFHRWGDIIRVSTI